MRHFVHCLAPAAGALLLAAADARAQGTATVIVTFEVRAVSEIGFSGNPGHLVINTAPAGGAPTSVSDRSTTWSVTTNQTDRKITAAVGAALPVGVTLAVSMAAPAGAVSSGPVPLGAEARDLVTGLSTLRATGMPVEYTLSANPGAGIVPASSTEVVFTITAGA